MVLPNAQAAVFCDWLLNISWQKLSGPQRVLVETVYAAASTGGAITNQQWLNFNKFTAWRYPFFQVYDDLAVQIPSTLLVDLWAAYNFEGNSVDSENGHDGTDSNMAYGSPTGSLGQSAIFNGVTSKIITPTFTPPGPFSLAFRLWVDSAASANGGIYGPVSGAYGPYYYEATSILQFPANIVTGGAATMSKGAWVNYVITWDGTNVQFYQENVAVGLVGNLTVTPDLNSIGWHNFGWYLKGYMNFLFIWNKILDSTERAAIYNGGTGLKWPFT